MSLRRRQQLFLDAIEHSFSMAKIAYTRIVTYCRNDSSSDLGAKDDELVLDAWSFIDVLKRLRSALMKTPGLQHGTVLTEFLQATKSVVDFRDHHQHIEERIAKVAPSGRPIWGAFSWVVMEPGKNMFRIGAYLPGRVAETDNVPMANPAGREIRSEVDLFQITVGETTLHISDMHYQLMEFQEKFNFALSAAQPRAVPSGEEILAINLDSLHEQPIWQPAKAVPLTKHYSK